MTNFMTKKILIIILLFFSVFIFCKIDVKAKGNIISDNILILDNKTCGSEDNSILGSVNDESSVAWLVQRVFNYVKVGGPLLVILLSSVDFIQVIIKSDADEMKKAGKKLSYRLVLAAMIFFIPTLVMVMLHVFNITSDALCGIE